MRNEICKLKIELSLNQTMYYPKKKMIAYYCVYYEKSQQDSFCLTLCIAIIQF